MGVPSTVAVFLALLVAILVGAGTITIVIWGVVDQWSDIYGQALLGWRSFTRWVGELDIDPRWLEDARTALVQARSLCRVIRATGTSAPVAAPTRAAPPATGTSTPATRAGRRSCSTPPRAETADRASSSVMSSRR